jgi:hypothetical protein
MPAKKRPLTKSEKKRREAAKQRQLAFARRAKAVELFREDWTIVRIASELDVNPATVTRWLKDEGVRDPRPKRASAPPAEEVPADPEDPTPCAPADLSELDPAYAARAAERNTLAEVAENQASVADQYQAYVAGHAIKLLRDSFQNIRGPRTVRELSELDQLVRRSLGLNPKGNTGAGGGLTIDISILNNSKATKKPNNVTVTVPAEEVLTDDEDEDE